MLPESESRRICLECQTNLISHLSKCFQDFPRLPHGMGRIIEPPMMTVHLPRKHRARLIRISAYRNDDIDVRMLELLQVLRTMPGNVDADLLHYLNRQRMDPTGWL